MPKKQRIYDYFYEFASEALHIVIFENFVKSIMSCLSKLKVTPSFCFAFKIPDDPTATTVYDWLPFKKLDLFLHTIWVHGIKICFQLGSSLVKIAFWWHGLCNKKIGFVFSDGCITFWNPSTVAFGLDTRVTLRSLLRGLVSTNF